MQKKRINKIIQTTITDETILSISDKIINKQRLNEAEGLILFEKFPLHLLSLLANYVRENQNQKKVFFNKNFHIEPTNICIYNCKFCSYKRHFGDADAWDYSIEDILEICRKYEGTDVTELHITGGVHPHYDVRNYSFLLKKIKEVLPQVHIKAFTAVEIYYMCRKARISVDKGLEILIKSGLGSLPGGGAEIFDTEIRHKICGDKIPSNLWLNIHEKAHNAGLFTNATMLYGHLEHYTHRISHLTKLRDLQDKTNKFNAFIPLKFRNFNNKLSELKEVSIIEDMKNYAVSRLYLDNFPHIKAYWVMLGRNHAQMSLAYGVDDLDGTINNTTKIYTMAGSDEQTPGMTPEQMIEIISKANYIPVERDSIYNEIKIFK